MNSIKQVLMKKDRMTEKEAEDLIQQKLKDPTYLKWRKENPPNGSPILYRNKYFRSIQEASNYFKVSRPKIDRDLLKNLSGCRRLSKKNKYPYEIIY